MQAIVVGADKLGSIPQMLASMGFTIEKHILGRLSGHQRRLLALPAGTDFLNLFTDLLGHNVCAVRASSHGWKTYPLSRAGARWYASPNLSKGVSATGS